MILPYLLLTCAMAKGHRQMYVEAPVLIDFKNMKADGGGSVLSGLPPIGQLSDIQGKIGTEESESFNPQKIVNATIEGARILKTLYPDESSTGKTTGPEWSSCKDFASKGHFDPSELDAKTWLPFYVWSEFNVVPFNFLNFSEPTPKLLSYYATYYQPLTSNIDWWAPKLVMQDGYDEFLLIRADEKGLYHAIRNVEDIELKDHRIGRFMMPRMQFRLRIISHYLLLINCYQHLAIATAPRKALPTGRVAKMRAAEAIGFRGHGWPLEKREAPREEKFRDTRSDYIRRMRQSRARKAAN